MGQTIGILGGSFNPIHYGHLQMAKVAMEELRLDRVFLIPAGDPPHKSDELADKRHRLRMAELAAESPLEVSSMEIDRTGKTYTVDTLEALQAMYADASLVMIIGADTLGEIATWKSSERVFSLCRFAVVSRGDIQMPEVPGARVTHIKAQVPPISATGIRGRVAAGLSLADYTPPEVEAYIGMHRLYHPPRRMEEAEILRQLKNDLSKERYAHVVCTRWMINQLAKRWGYDMERAGLTALLHDCAKEMSLDAMRAFVDAQGASVDSRRKQTKALLHAPASAERARAFYGVTDPEILRAIWYHNTGCTPMSLLAELLFVADFTEPSRRMFPALGTIRRLAMIDLRAAVREVYETKLEYMHAKGIEAHPDTANVLAAFSRIG